MIVMKFGGSSVRDAAAFRQVLEIVSRAEGNRVVALSACQGITNDLIDLALFASSNNRDAINARLADLRARHIQILSDLIDNHPVFPEAKHSIESRLAYLETYLAGISYLREASPKSTDTVLSFGELLSTEIFYWFARSRSSKIKLIGAAKLIATDDCHNTANVDFNATCVNISNQFPNYFQSADILLTQGFIGATPAGVITTLGRGGSDYSAAILGYACNKTFEKVDEIQIWTDVNGVMSADPRIVPNAVTIPVMSFSLIRELSFHGAKVLHPDTIKPAIEGNIPVRVLNTFNSNNSGTLILDDLKSINNSYYSIIVKNSTEIHNNKYHVSGTDSAAINELHDDILIKIENNINHIHVLNPTKIKSDSDNLREAKMIVIAGETISGKDLADGEKIRKSVDYLMNFAPELCFFGHSSHSVSFFFKPEAEISPEKLHSLLIPE